MGTSIKCEMVTYTWTMTMVAGPCLRPADTGTEVVLANMEYCGRAENNFGSRHCVRRHGQRQRTTVGNGWPPGRLDVPATYVFQRLVGSGSSSGSFNCSHGSV